MAATALLALGVTSVGVALANQVAPPAPVAAPSSLDLQLPQTSPRAAVRRSPSQEDQAQEQRARERSAAQEKTATATPRAPAGSVEDRGPGPDPARQQAQTAPPVRVSVPSLGIDSPLVPLGLTPTGEIEAPETYDRAGWFEQGPRPGDTGAAVIAGHVDSRSGPAVFYHLSSLKPGAEIVVERADGSAATFRVQRLARYPKDDFPTVEVYATNDRELRLITCGGDFSEGDYQDNVVVFATLTT